MSSSQGSCVLRIPHERKTHQTGRVYPGEADEFPFRLMYTIFIRSARPFPINFEPGTHRRNEGTFAGRSEGGCPASVTIMSTVTSNLKKGQQPSGKSTAPNDAASLFTNCTSFWFRSIVFYRINERNLMEHGLAVAHRNCQQEFASDDGNPMLIDAPGFFVLGANFRSIHMRYGKFLANLSVFG